VTSVEKLEQEVDWTLATFEGIRRAQRMRNESASLPQILRELEELRDLADRLTPNIEATEKGLPPV
jgi:hypothetical protein